MKNFILILCFFGAIFSSEAQHLKGYSIGHLFHSFPNHKINQEGVDLFDSLSPDVLRFPGGTIANKYRFYKTGYGYSSIDKKRPENYIEEYIRLVKKMKTKPKTVFVMNLLDHYKGENEAALIKENMDALKHLIDNGMEVIAVELGNEFYLYSEIVGFPGVTTVNPELNNTHAIETGNENNQQTSNPKKKENILIRWLRNLTGKYSGNNKAKSNAAQNTSVQNKNANSDVDPRLIKFERLAKIYDEKIKALYPSIKTGVPVGNLINEKHNAYNNFVLANFPFVDAFVVHFYGSFNKNCKEGDIECVRRGLNWSLKKSTIPRLEYINNNTNKEIWVTEWNSIKFGHWGGENAWVRNTPIHNEYIKKYIDVFNQYGVTISNFHKLAGKANKASYNAIDVEPSGKCKTTTIYETLKKYY